MAPDGVCKFWREGRCTWGDDCKFRHLLPDDETEIPTDRHHQDETMTSEPGERTPRRRRRDSIGFVIKGVAARSQATEKPTTDGRFKTDARTSHEVVGKARGADNSSGNDARRQRRSEQLAQEAAFARAVPVRTGEDTVMSDAVPALAQMLHQRTLSKQLLAGEYSVEQTAARTAGLTPLTTSPPASTRRGTVDQLTEQLGSIKAASETGMDDSMGPPERKRRGERRGAVNLEREDAVGQGEEAEAEKVGRSSSIRCAAPDDISRTTALESSHKIFNTGRESASPAWSGDMGATKRMSNGEAKVPVGPHPSTIRVSAQYQTQAAIERRLQQPGADAQERSLAEAKEDSLRLQGVQWIDVVRRALQLPIRTYTTACTYYHRFRLAHPPGTGIGDSYLWSDAAAASLLNACKMEDTLKKSKEILAASYNLKVSAAHEQLAADDPIFEPQSRAVIGLERLVLEAGTFDFRGRAPHQTLTKIARGLGRTPNVQAVHDLAWTALTDLYRTFSPLKHTSATLAFAMLELAARLLDEQSVLAQLQSANTDRWYTTREEVMEVILDSVDLYIQHTTASILGTRYSLDDFLRVRLALKKECDDSGIPRNCTAPAQQAPTSKVQNGHPTPVSPPQAASAQPPQPAPPAPQFAAPVAGGTLRFMLNPHLAKTERDTVDNYFKEEWEEYEEEIEIPLPRSERRPTGPPSSRASSRDRRSDRDDRDRDLDRRPPPRSGAPPRRDRDRRDGPPHPPHRPYDDRRERDRRDRDRDRDYERDRRPPRDRERDRRYEDDRRRYDERERRYDDRRYDDRRPPRDERRYRDDRR